MAIHPVQKKEDIMSGKFLKCRMLLSVMLIVSLLSCPDIFAEGPRNHDRGQKSSGRQDRQNHVRYDRQNYRNEKQDNEALFWSGIGITALVLGAIIASTPPKRQQAARVIQQPVIVTQPAPYSDGLFPVNIPGPNGTYTTVMIRRYGAGFLGPQGEYYPEFPRMDILDAIYVR